MSKDIEEGYPIIITDLEKGYFSVSGRSYPENPVAVYQHLIDSLNEYCLKPRPHTTVEFDLEYCNTSSIKIFMNLLMNLKNMVENKQVEVEVIWKCEKDDVDNCELGLELQKLSGLPFRISKSLST